MEPKPPTEKPQEAVPEPAKPEEANGEVGGRKGPEPTRYGDWEIGGKCVDF